MEYLPDEVMDFINKTSIYFDDEFTNVKQKERLRELLKEMADILLDEYKYKPLEGGE